MDYFTSDLHFGHFNVIKWCKRPFLSVEEMNEALVERWNETVKDNDTVYVVGDVFLCDSSTAESYIKRLNGYKILIKGNHDRNEKTMLRVGFDEFHKKLTYVMPDGRKALVQHRPISMCLIDDHDLLIHGHIHITENFNNRINVSCDMWDFKPASINEIMKLDLDDIKDNDRVEFSLDRERIIISAEFNVENFSGLVEHIYSEIIDKQGADKK
jgi:calcineurin-like phosphoesterase family protein